MNKDKRIQIFSRLRDANPNPQTELEYSSDFELLIAVLLSAQATDVRPRESSTRWPIPPKLCWNWVKTVLRTT